MQDYRAVTTLTMRPGTTTIRSTGPAWPTYRAKSGCSFRIWLVSSSPASGGVSIRNRTLPSTRTGTMTIGAAPARSPGSGKGA